MPEYQNVSSRFSKSDLSALTRVCKHLRRTQSDTIRYLVAIEDERIRSEMKRANVAETASAQPIPAQP